MENFYAYILIGFIVTILLFLIFREVVCWYYKINESISLQIKTNELLEILSKFNSAKSENKNDVINQKIDDENLTSNEIIEVPQKLDLLLKHRNTF